MGFIKFENSETIYEGFVKTTNQNVVRISKSIIPNANTSGFVIALDRDMVNIYGEFTNYTTLFRNEEEFFELSNDGSVYVEPEPLPEPEWNDAILEQGQSIEERLTVIEDEIVNTQIAVTEVYEMMLGV